MCLWIFSVDRNVYRIHEDRDVFMWMQQEQNYCFIDQRTRNNPQDINDQEWVSQCKDSSLLKMGKVNCRRKFVADEWWKQFEEK